MVLGWDYQSNSEEIMKFIWYLLSLKKSIRQGEEGTQQELADVSRFSGADSKCPNLSLLDANQSCEMRFRKAILEMYLYLISHVSLD